MQCRFGNLYHCDQNQEMVCLTYDTASPAKLSKGYPCVSCANRAVWFEHDALWRSESPRWCVDIMFAGGNIRFSLVGQLNYHEIVQHYEVEVII